MKLVTRKQMNLIDALASSRYHIPSLILMEHAGMGVVQHLLTYPKETKFLIVCGSGNNGGDGFVIARALHQKGYVCDIDFIGDENHLTQDAKINKEIVDALGVHYVTLAEGYDVIVDAIFGTGLTRTIEGKYADVIQKINQQKQLGTTIISIDIPSGVDSDNGSIYGVAIKSDITYTMQCPKQGMYQHPGYEYCGDIISVDIGIPNALIDECASETYLIEETEMWDYLPTRVGHSHKGSYGKLLCIGGSKGMSGAISMAATSALKSGVGLLTCMIPESIYPIVAKNVWESMCVVAKEKDGCISRDALPQLEEAISKATTLLIGCGLGRSEELITIIESVLASHLPSVIDADGLFALHACREQLKTCDNVIITPHMKEFADLMDLTLAQVMENPYEYIDMFTSLYPNVTLVLKSDISIIARGNVRYINTYGNNGLAVGGSGDVLAGMIAGFYAQNNDPLKAATLGVFLHAYSADQLLTSKSVYSITPSDIITQMETILHRQEQKGNKE